MAPCRDCDKVASTYWKGQYYCDPCFMWRYGYKPEVGNPNQEEGVPL